MARKRRKIKKKVIKSKKTKEISSVKLVEAEKPKEELRLKKTKIRVIGVGEGGCSIVSEIASRVQKATFVAANTNRQALKEVNRNVIRFQFGENFTHGLGTGMNPELGETAAIAEKDKIKPLFQGQDLCIIIACLGGGTGSGAAPIFAKIAKSSGALTYGIFTIPFKFEGEKKMAIAKNALEQLKPRLHALSIVPNERIFQIIEKETPLRQALSAINERLAKGLEGLIEIIYEPGLINIDFADLKTILQGQGRLSYLNSVEAPRKEGVVQEAIEKLLNSPLYPYGIRGAKSVLYNISGEKSLTLSEVSQISKTISDLVNKEAKIIFGISQNQKYSGLIKTTLLATGCGTKIFAGETKKRKRISKKKPFEKEMKQKKEEEKRPNQPPKVVKKKQKIKIIKKAKRQKRKKMRPKAPKKTKIKVIPQVEEIKQENMSNPPEEGKVESRIRKNALQIKKEAEEAEKEMLEREKFWETPAFLRRKRII